MKSHGFWITFDGNLFEMKKPQHHDWWLVATLNKSPRDALEEGWVSVSFDASMNSCGIRHRPGAVDYRILKPLRTILKDYEFYEREVHTDFDKGLGKDVMIRLGNTCTSSSGKPIFVQYAELRLRIQEAQKRQYEAERGLKAEKPDLAALRTKLLNLRETCVRALRSQNLGYENIKKLKNITEILDAYGFYVGHEASRSMYYVRDELQQLVNTVCDAPDKKEELP